MGNEYDFIFATSSRLATSYLGFIISKITKKHLYLDIRDIFSDNIKSIKLFRGNIGNLFSAILSKIEINIINYSSWVNFVSPGFANYSHLKFLRSDYTLFTNGIDDIFIKNRRNFLRCQIKIKIDIH